MGSYRSYPLRVLIPPGRDACLSPARLQQAQHSGECHLPVQGDPRSTPVESRPRGATGGGAVRVRRSQPNGAARDAQQLPCGVRPRKGRRICLRLRAMHQRRDKLTMCQIDLDAQGCLRSGAQGDCVYLAVNRAVSPSLCHPNETSRWWGGMLVDARNDAPPAPIGGRAWACRWLIGASRMMVDLCV